MSRRHTLRAVAIAATAALMATLTVVGVDHAGASPGSPRGWVDSVTVVPGGVEVAGWAVDADRPAEPVTVHVYANGGYVDGRRASALRPDVNAALGVTGGHGFGWTVPLGNGSWEICVYALGVSSGGTPDGDNPRVGCRNVTIGSTQSTSGGSASALAPRGSLDRVRSSDHGITIAGWALDGNAPTSAVTIQVWSNGRFLDSRRADSARADVNAALGVDGGHGFGWTVPAGPGIHEVCIYAMGLGAGASRSGPDSLLGCRRVAVGGEAAADVQTRLLQLGYWHADPAGTFGDGTTHAVTALQKVAGLPLTGVVDAATRAALDDGVRPAARSRSGRVMEVDLDLQVLYVVDTGHIDAILDISTGKASTPTPPGRFEVFRDVNAWDPGPYGSLYRPRYFVGGIAFHGFGSVPTSPASHGCVRLTLEAMDWVWAENIMPIGTDVWVY